MPSPLTVRQASAAALVAAALAPVVLALPAAAAVDATYTDAATFAAAAGATTVESFEANAARSREGAALSTPGFTVTPAVAGLGVQTGPFTPDDGHGAFATDGSHYLSVYLADAPQGDLVFTLAAPSTAFALAITDVGEALGSVTLRTDAGAFTAAQTLLNFTSTVGNGQGFFIGLTQALPFTQVTLNVSGIDDAYGIDAVQVSAVPEPGTHALLAGGVAALALLARRRDPRR